jgi:hypothetical protein
MPSRCFMPREPTDLLAGNPGQPDLLQHLGDPRRADRVGEAEAQQMVERAAPAMHRVGLHAKPACRIDDEMPPLADSDDLITTIEQLVRGGR